MIKRLLLAAVSLSGCTTIHVATAYNDADVVRINHRERSFEVRYAYDILPPEVFITRDVVESVATVALRHAARRLELTDYSRPDEALEREYMKQVIGMTIKEGCEIAREGDGGTKFFSVGNSSHKFIATLQCQKIE